MPRLFAAGRIPARRSSPAVTTHNMAMEFYCPATRTTRTLALPPGLTAEEANDWASKWQGAMEVMVGVVQFT
jgi:hypothetical protein